ncbi:protein trichome birefringence-like 30 isoform X1 [Raphanus sativus]|uniref:Protein trichome birefringence-like 30 isoform X1 n=1 Tax=Raphanus sativus TaxID=3726 RepID=A0A9W3CYW5_RAPSA|nr:protein trichome birefringence-like 30 isoform X1 [Raphanus sativus]
MFNQFSLMFTNQSNKMKQTGAAKRSSYLYVLYVVIIVLLLFLLGCYLYNEKQRIGQFQGFKTDNLPEEHISPLQQSKEEKDKKIDLVALKVCDVFTGKWVLDEVTHPLYKEDECEFLSEWVACTRNGRPDSKYQKWRWQPRDCSLPRFDAKLLLEKLRGKKLMFIGDSIHYNQWQSMVCMVQSTISSGTKTLSHTAQMSIFNTEEYNTTISFYWAPFLVESNADPPDKRDGKREPIIMPRSISKHGKNWKDADFLVFNTYTWWTRHSKIKVLRQGSFTNETKESNEVGIYIMYEEVLRTWTNWLEQNIDPNRTSVFFSSMSPTHVRSSDWDVNGRATRKCEKETEPILNMSKPVDVGTNRRLREIAVNVTKSTTKVHVTFLNVTTMSEFRKDAHTSFYGSRSGSLLTPGQKLDPRTFADCYHWCLPGLPDTWNELLSLYIINKS